MLVDDDRARAAVVEAKLRQAGFAVLAVIPTGSGLLFQVAQHEPDVVIIALDSPDRDVLESLAIATSHNPRPVVMFSGAGDQGFISDAIRAGVSAYHAEHISADRARVAIDVAVAQFRTFNDLKRELDDTRRQLDDRRLVEQAKGLLMAQHKIAEEEAFHALRKLAMDRHRSLGDTAREVIAAMEKSKPGRRRPGNRGPGTRPRTCT
ncbi:MAG: ANTAR domain-containing protein [Pseudomonadales bacterium]|nr:ANTAR domain-containing protein [Halioglobus sp.]MCP5120928.1 ANTAR domain-containing protein [Pseudomonadales bacterium]MCP5194370.1 ANTAR domain-containing protein [Pseudomonadales bacterium]